MSNKKNYAENLARSVYHKGIKTGDVRYLVEIAKILGQYEEKDINIENAPNIKVEIVDNDYLKENKNE